MTTVSIPNQLRPALQTKQWIRNGRYPAANATTFLQQETNRLLRYRTKMCSFSTPISAVPASSGTSRNRWRAAIHTSTHARHLLVSCEFMGGTGNSPVLLVTVTTTGGSVVGYARVSAKNDSTGTAPDGWITRFGVVRDSNGLGDPVEITPDTDYLVTFTEFEGARTITAVLYEESLAPSDTNGYIASGVTAGEPVYDAHRAAITQKLRNAWKRNAAGLWFWASSTDSTAPNRGSATLANIFDQTHTSVTAASPGVTLSLANRSTLRRGTVPVKLWVHAGSGSSGTGSIVLASSGGTVATIATTTGSTWLSATFDLPATDAKYDLMFQDNASDGGTTIRAASLWQFE